MKKLITLTLAIMLILTTTPTLAATTEVKINDWPLMKEAIAHETAKAYDQAMPYWEKLVALYASYQTLYAYENGGHFANKLGDYYAGELNPAIFKPSLAALYYDKAYHSYFKLSELDGTTKFNWAYVTAQRKWDLINSEIDLYVRKDLATEPLPARPLALHEPESGLFIGTYGGNNVALYKNHTYDPEGIRLAYGETPASLLYYNIYGESPFPINAAAKMKAVGGSLQIQMQPYNLDDVKDASYIREFARAARESGIPIFLRFGGEMNGNWVPWGLQPVKYIQKFKLVHDIMASDAPNVAMVWAPNFFPWDNMAEYYPGDAYVDWVGVSCYTTLSYTDETKTMKLNANPIDLLKHIVEAYGDRKPVMIVEGAVSYRSTTEPAIDYTDWAVNNLKRFYEYIPRVYPEIKAFYYYDSTGVAGEQESYMLTENEKLKKTYSNIIKNDYYLSNMDTAPFNYAPLEQTLEKKLHRISAYVKSYEPVIAQVVYYIDDKRVQVVNELPFEFAYDFSMITSPSVKITAKAYLADGTLATSKDYHLKLVSPAIKVLYNGEVLRFDQLPTVVEGRTLVPMKTIFETFGMSVSYEASTKTITAKNASHTIRLTIGNSVASVDGQSVTLDVPPRIISGRTMVPLKFISQSLGLGIEYDAKARIVMITE